MRLSFDTAARVLADWGPVRFVLVGDGSLKNALRDQVARLGLGPHFHFAGFQPDTVPCFRPWISP